MSIDFEARYRAEPDPWGYLTRPYERDKYAATLAACGDGPFASALELGGSIGVFSAMLAPRTDRLRTIDGSPTAVAAARRRLGGRANVTVDLGAIPQDIAHGPYDLVIASEMLYYLTAEGLEATLGRLRDEMSPGARLVAVHWRPGGPERPLEAADVHARLHAQDWLAAIAEGHTGDYLLDVLERRC